MGNAYALRDRARIMDVLPGATGAGAMDGGAVVIELERHADDVITLRLEQRRGDRGINSARHGDDHAGVLRATFDIEAVEHRAPVRLKCAGRTSRRALRA